MKLFFKKYTEFTKITNKEPICLTGKLTSDIFQLNNKWYLKVNINEEKNIIGDIDNQCNIYMLSNNPTQIYQSCIFEDSILIKIPYRYKKFEATCINSTFYDLKPDQHVQLCIEVNSISEFKSNTFTCCFKLKSLKLLCQKKHPHALLGNEVSAT